MSNTAVQNQPKKSIFSVFGTGRAVWIVAIAFSLAAMFGVMSLLGDATKQTTYFVLNQNVSARVAITPAMLTEVSVTDGGQPGNAFDVDYIQTHTVYAKVALDRGDVVSSSNAGPATRLTEDLPDNFVAASFNVTADNAVGGKVRSGDYIDIIAQSDGDETSRVAKVVLSRVYVLDVSVSAETLQENSGGEIGTEDAAAQTDLQGVPALYTVAVAPQDAVKIAQIRDKTPFVVLSSKKSAGDVDVQQDLADMFTEGAVKDSSEGIKSKAESTEQPSAGQ